MSDGTADESVALAGVDGRALEAWHAGGGRQRPISVALTALLAFLLVFLCIALTLFRFAGNPKDVSSSGGGAH